MAAKETSQEERKRRIRELMEHAGMTRREAEFAVAVDLGELPGDVIVVDDEQKNGMSRGSGGARVSQRQGDMPRWGTAESPSLSARSRRADIEEMTGKPGKRVKL